VHGSFNKTGRMDPQGRLLKKSADDTSQQRTPRDCSFRVYENASLNGFSFFVGAAETCRTMIQAVMTCA
jgi:hypothetical protein